MQTTEITILEEIELNNPIFIEALLMVLVMWVS